MHRRPHLKYWNIFIFQFNYSLAVKICKNIKISNSFNILNICNILLTCSQNKHRRPHRSTQLRWTCQEPAQHSARLELLFIHPICLLFLSGIVFYLSEIVFIHMELDFYSSEIVFFASNCLTKFDKDDKGGSYMICWAASPQRCPPSR